MRGDRLKQLRKERKLRQEDLGRIINVTKVSISGYENGDRTPDTDNLKRLADYFGVTTDYLLGRSDNPKLTAEQERILIKEEKEILDLLDQFPEEERKEILAKFKAYIEFSMHAKDKD